MNEKDMSTFTKDTSVGINILLVVDTAKIENFYTTNQNKTINGILVQPPSTTAASPTQLHPDLKGTQWLICDSPRGIVNNQGTSDLNFRANANDRVSFVGTSIEANSDSAVIVYGLKSTSTTNVFNTFNQNWANRKQAVMPAQTIGVPAILKDATFATYAATVFTSGVESFNLNFAQYFLDDAGQTQKLYGYFRWDPTITVSGPKP